MYSPPRGTTGIMADGSLNTAEAIGRGHLSFVLHGRKLRGGFPLTRMRRRARPPWLLVKKADEPVGGTWC